MSFDIAPKHRWPWVALLRFRSNGLEDDRVQVPLEGGAGYPAVAGCHRTGGWRGPLETTHQSRWQRQGRQAPRPRPGKQFIQHHAQREHVGGKRNGAAIELFRRCVFRRQQHLRGDSAVVQQLGDAEIKQPHATAGIDHDVGRFQIAMHDQIAVRVVDGFAHLAKQLQSFAERQRFRVCVADQVNAFHELHRHVRPSIGRYPAVDQPGNSRVMQSGEDASLVFKLKLAVDRLGANQFQCHLLREICVGAVRQIDLAHSAPADQPIDDERAYRCARHKRTVIGCSPGRVCQQLRGQVQEAGFAVERKQHLRDMGLDLGMDGGLRQQCLAGGRGMIDQFVEQGRSFGPACLTCARHDVPVIVRPSQPYLVYWAAPCLSA